MLYAHSHVETAVGRLVQRAREAQLRWRKTPITDQLKIVRRFRQQLVVMGERMAQSAGHTRQIEGWQQVLTLADACQFLEREAKQILADRQVEMRGRPIWLGRVTAQVVREPFGVVLVIAPANYPLMLPGIQMVQAIVAGNAVVIKPGRGGLSAAKLLAEAVEQARLPQNLVTVLSESVHDAHEAIEAGVDKVLLTGSAQTGRQVLAQLAETLTPATMELSGCDAMFVLRGADMEMVAKALRFGTQYNDGHTCIAPKRLIVVKQMAEQVQEELDANIPIIVVKDAAEAAQVERECPYALGASIFGDQADAKQLAQDIRAGAVTINDVIVPTADPRLPFGGCGDSGFGVTRGREGLLELTRPRVITRTRGSFRPHYEPGRPIDVDLFSQYLASAHSAHRMSRLKGMWGVIRNLIHRGGS